MLDPLDRLILYHVDLLFYILVSMKVCFQASHIDLVSQEHIFFGLNEFFPLNMTIQFLENILVFLDS